MSSSIPTGPNVVDLSAIAPAQRTSTSHLVRPQPMKPVDPRIGARKGFGSDMHVPNTQPLDERVAKLASTSITQITKELAAAEDYASERERFIIDPPSDRRPSRRGSAPELGKAFEPAGIDSSLDELQETQSESGKSSVESDDVIGSGSGALLCQSGVRKVTLMQVPSLNMQDEYHAEAVGACAKAKKVASLVFKGALAVFSRIQKSVSGFFEKRAEESRQKAAAAAEKEAREKPAKMRREFNEHFYNKLDGAVKNIGDAFKRLESETSNGPKTTKAFNAFIDSIYKEAQIVIDLMHFAQDQVRKGKDGPEIYQTALQVCQNALEKLKTSLGEQLTQSDDLKGVLALNVRNNLLSLLQTAKDAKGNMRFTQEQALAISGDLAHLHADKGELAFILLLHIAGIKGGQRYEDSLRDLVAGHLNLRVQSKSDLQSVSSQLNEMPFLNPVLINRGFRLFIFDAIPKKLVNGASVEEIEIFTQEMLNKAIELQIFEGDQDERIGDFLRTIQQENKEAFIEALFNEYLDAEDAGFNASGIVNEVNLVISQNEKSAIIQAVNRRIQKHEESVKQREQEEIGRVSEELLQQLQAHQKEVEEAALAEAKARADLKAAQEAKEQSIVGNFQERLQSMDSRLDRMNRELIEPIALMQKQLLEVGESANQIKMPQISYKMLDGTVVQGSGVAARKYYLQEKQAITQKGGRDAASQLKKILQLEQDAQKKVSEAAAEASQRQSQLDEQVVQLLTRIEENCSQIVSGMREMSDAMRQIEADVKDSKISEERQRVVTALKEALALKCKAIIDSMKDLQMEIDLSSSFQLGLKTFKDRSPRLSDEATS